MKIFVLLITSITVTQCAKILCIFPMPARSHYILGSALTRGLAEKGHDVTMISLFKEKNPPKNGTYRDIDLPEVLKFLEEDKKDMNFFEMGDISPLLLMPFFLSMGPDFTEPLLNHSKVQALLKSEEKFDVVIVEQFLNDVLKGFASHFKAPLISFSTMGANTWVNMLTGNPSPSSYIPDIMLSYSSEMSFEQRAFNFFFQILSHLGLNCYSFPQHKKLYDKYFPNADPFYDVLYNSSLFFLNSHSSLNQAVPEVPNMIEIGGFHVQPPKKLPKDLQEFLDNAKEGVIYFSMGSNLQSTELPPAKRDAFLKTFAKLKQKVLWKWEDDDLPGKPDNVKTGKWLPQQDILAHPNVKLFISHGGLLSTTETVYHGVPVMTIPIFGDQKLNSQRIVNGGFGLTLSFAELTEETLTKKLTEILNNPKYATNAKKRSALFHDRLVSPMETAVYWVEYVVRHKGAPHLKVAGVDLPWYKYFLLDVIGFFIIVLYVLCKVVKFVLSLCCARKTTKKLKVN